MTSTASGTVRIYDDHFVDGRFQAATSGRSIEIVSPRSEEVIGRLALASQADIDRAVAAARTAFDEGEWPRTETVGARRCTTSPGGRACGPS